jgi:acyl dehydratase
MLRPFDALEIGRTDILGEHVFGRDEIVRFARAFDPQPFHLDEAAAARSHFGRLAASGWQTAATWMRLLVRARNAAAEEARAEGLAIPRFGPSPGFTDLRWLRPVHVGDAIRFATTLASKRPSGTRPGWGLTFSHNTGWNQHGEKVFEFSGGGFVALDPAAA